MGFFTPWFLAAAAAVGLPVWLHLLRKHKTTPQPFSSLMFFEKHIQSSIKHRRLRYLLLFAARTLLVLLIVLAFAEPYVKRTILPLKRTGEVTVLAIDNSLSMRAGDRLGQAKQMAKSAVAGLTTGERAQVLADFSVIPVVKAGDEDDALDALLRAEETGAGLEDLMGTVACGNDVEDADALAELLGTAAEIELQDDGLAELMGAEHAAKPIWPT